MGRWVGMGLQFRRGNESSNVNAPRYHLYLYLQASGTT